MNEMVAQFKKTTTTSKLSWT